MFRNELFSRSSEKRHQPPPDQVPLFGGDDDPAAGDTQTSEDMVVIAAHARKKRGRKALPKDLPRIDIIHDLSEEDKLCGCGQGKSCIGEDISEKLDYIPARLQVERHIRLKYACYQTDFYLGSLQRKKSSSGRVSQRLGPRYAG